MEAQDRCSSEYIWGERCGRSMIKDTGLNGGESTPSMVCPSSFAVGTFYKNISMNSEI